MLQKELEEDKERERAFLSACDFCSPYIALEGLGVYSKMKVGNLGVSGAFVR